MVMCFLYDRPSYFLYAMVMCFLYDRPSYFYSIGRPSAIWGVSSGAKNASASVRTKNLVRQRTGTLRYEDHRLVIVTFYGESIQKI